MAFVNPKKKEVQVKIVYYGPGRGGKTTNLEYIYQKFNNRIKTEMVTIKTHGDRTLFFDFLPFDIGKVNGYDVKAGELKKQVPLSPIFAAHHHHRCYRNKSTERFLLAARRGVECVDLAAGENITRSTTSSSE